MLVTILILVLVSLAPVQKVKAVAAEMAVVYFVYATIFGSCAISYATDGDFREGVKNFAIQVGDGVKNIVYTKAEQMANYIASAVGSIAGYKITFSAGEWQVITEAVNKYVSNAYSDVSNTIVAGSDGTLGFTKNSSFSANLSGGFCQLTLTDNCVISFYSPDLRQNILASLPRTDPSFLDTNNTSVYARLFVFSCAPFALHSYNADTPCNVNNKFAGTLKPSTENTYKGNGKFSFLLDCSSNGYGWQSLTFLQCNSYSDKDISMYRINNQVCYFARCTDNKYRFVSYEDFKKSNGIPAVTDDTCVPLINFNTNDTYYSFDSPSDMYYTVLDGAGLKHYTDSQKNESETDVYKPHAVPLGGSVPDVYTGTGGVTLTIPKSATGVDDYTAISEANPADIITYNTPYPDGVPNVDSSGLFDKFPFCLPKDLYNMITGFYAPAEAPVFYIPFKIWQNSDGSYLIDYTLTIDFVFLDPIIPIIRYGTSFIFVIGLVLITRKMIGAQ